MSGTVAQLTIHDRDGYQRYVSAFLPVLTQHGGRVLAADDNPEVIGGPCTATGLSCWSSPTGTHTPPGRHGLSTNLGYPQAGEELIRSGWAYATVIDHRPLMAWLRLDGAYAAYWSGRPRQSLALAERGLEYLSDGHNAAQLHLYRGLAAAHIGDADTARRAITAASQARERDHNDELLEIGGEFGFSRAAHHYYAGFTLTDVPGAAADAVNELERAAELYAAGPGPGEDHSHKCWMLAHADLATAWLRARQLDAAATALDPVLALSPGNRTAVLAQRLAVLRTELGRPALPGLAPGRRT